MKHIYQTTGVCSRKIIFNLEDGVITDINFEGGCNGNLQGISRLVKGQRAEEVIQRCKGICCGYKKTSCPDQLSIALQQALESDQKSHQDPDSSDIERGK